MGTGDVVIKVGDTFNELDKVTAEDIFGISLTNITVEGLSDLNLDTPGEYKLTYKVTDAAGNETIVERIVTVTAIETSNPENNDSIEKNKLVQDTDKEINSNNPSTGDKGIFGYVLMAMASAIGLVKNTKKKKN
ncbi:immunoglobulin-like domain-containing protein [uncultured Clostridium sp.]|uniref:immunoglobulin-like domain-containing protein n=1 Tax=uncultured Clostridium sp. TaxID=59620 RepID=UPI00343017DA